MEKIMNKLLLHVCFGFLFLLVLVPQQVSAKDRKEILIGSHIPLSGVGSLVGRDQKWAYDRAVEDINKAGGIFVKEYGRKLPVKLVVMDDESDPGKAAAAVERLIKRTKVDLMLSGQVGAMGVIPGMIAAEKYKTYYHGSVIWVPNFLEHHFKYCTMYFFDMTQGGAMTFEVWNSLPETLRPKRVGLFLEDTFDGKMMGDVWARLAKEFGYPIVCRETMGMAAKDFTPQVLEGKAANVDAILSMANVPEAITLVRQMKHARFNVKYFQGIKGTWATEFYNALGKDSDYIFCDGFWSMDYPFPGARELGQRYYDEFGKYSVGIGMYYALCQTLWAAIEKAGTLDDLKVRQAVIDNEFMTVNGKVDYDERGIALFPLADFQWFGGKQMVIYPFEHTKYKVKPAPPWSER
jgi:branched-chain amino acid transport system substrate-binding protein